MENPTEAMQRRHTVKSFDEELADLAGQIVQMGAYAEQQIAHAIQALVERDDDLALQVIERDQVVDRFEEAIDQQAIRMLATRQPMAVDLRVISMSLKISNALERISDYAKSIAKRARSLSTAPQLKPFVTIPRMAGLTQIMLKDVLDAFITRDAEKAMDVWHRDQAVDDEYDSLFRELVTFILEDPRNTPSVIDLLFIAKNIERIGDHTTNIAEKIHYMVHGTQINRPGRNPVDVGDAGSELQ
jgi:phosphate transport system protein